MVKIFLVFKKYTSALGNFIIFHHTDIKEVTNERGACYILTEILNLKVQPSKIQGLATQI